MWKGMRCIWPASQTPPHRAELQRDKIQLVASERQESHGFAQPSLCCCRSTMLATRFTGLPKREGESATELGKICSLAFRSGQTPQKTKRTNGKSYNDLQNKSKKCTAVRLQLAAGLLHLIYKNPSSVHKEISSLEITGLDTHALRTHYLSL